MTCLRSSADLKPAIGPDTAILPLLNGMAHLDVLDEAFGAAHVLGGLCVIATTLADDGAIVHLNDSQTFTFGERDGKISPRVEAIKAQFADTKVPMTASPQILQEMWEKWVFLASLAASTCLMRAPVGAIVAAPGGAEFMLAMIEECRAIAEGEGFRAARGGGAALSHDADDAALAAYRLDAARHREGRPD